MLYQLSDHQSIALKYIQELRDVNIQTERLRFRRNLERLGEIFAYEISKKLDYTETETETPLGIANSVGLKDRVVLATILRAGLPFHEGMLNIFDHADNAFVSTYRQHHKDGSFEVRLQYITCPPIDDAVLILADPLLATGSSIDKTLKALLENGKPKEIHVVTVIASTYGIDHMKRNFPDINLWVGEVDEELTAKSYIVPGLGDAGDLSYGEKNID